MRCFASTVRPRRLLPRCFVTAVAGAAPPDTNLSFPFKFKRVRERSPFVCSWDVGLTLSLCAGRGCAAAAGGDFRRAQRAPPRHPPQYWFPSMHLALRFKFDRRFVSTAPFFCSATRHQPPLQPLILACKRPATPGHFSRSHAPSKTKCTTHTHHTLSPPALHRSRSQTSTPHQVKASCMGIHIAVAPPSRASVLQSLRIFFSTSLPAPLTVQFHPLACAAPCPVLAASVATSARTYSSSDLCGGIAAADGTPLQPRQT